MGPIVYLLLWLRADLNLSTVRYGQDGGNGAVGRGAQNDGQRLSRAYAGPGRLVSGMSHAPLFGGVQVGGDKAAAAAAQEKEAAKMMASGCPVRRGMRFHHP